MHVFHFQVNVHKSINPLAPSHRADKERLFKQRRGAKSAEKKQSLGSSFVCHISAPIIVQNSTFRGQSSNVRKLSSSALFDPLRCKTPLSIFRLVFTSRQIPLFVCCGSFLFLFVQHAFVINRHHFDELGQHFAPAIQDVLGHGRPGVLSVTLYQIA